MSSCPSISRCWERSLRARLPHVPAAPTPHLSALLSQALLAFTLECEQQSPVTLAVGANLVRVLDEQGERRWEQRFGEKTIREVRESLEQLVGAPGADSRLFEGLEPYPDGWRASLPPSKVLPHHPMVLHRGGFPDGS